MIYEHTEHAIPLLWIAEQRQFVYAKGELDGLRECNPCFNTRQSVYAKCKRRARSSEYQYEFTM
jgi:hypothetical protein